ncbi:hypothetical protein CPB86DRAFT_812712 [Serendipita vermifera]|nr:hypothetical protein CPB86DRAFT_812712 [Serendipita vermifera]
MEDTLEESLTKDGVYNLDQLGNMGFANDRDDAPRFRRRRQLGCTQERLLVDMPQGFREKIRNVPSVYFVCVLSSREMRASTRESVDHLPVTLLGLARPEYWRAKRFTSEASFILIRADLVRYAPCGINMVKVQWNAQPGIYASTVEPSGLGILLCPESLPSSTMSSQTAMASNTQTSQTEPNGPVVESSSQGDQSQPAGPELMQEQVQNAAPSQTVCTHTAPGSLANFELWFEGEDPKWRAAERTILTMRDAINREAGENDTAEIEQTAEDSEMDLDDLEASQAAFAAHVAFVFATYGVDTNQ